MSTQKAPPPPLHFQYGALGFVFLGGALGAAVRGLVSYSASPTHAIMAIFVVNIVGSFLLGYLLEWLSNKGPDDGWRRRLRLFLGTGLCGALTTYSTFSMDILHLWGAPGPWRDSQPLVDGFLASTALALVYALASILLGVAAALCGIAVGAGVVTSPRQLFTTEPSSSSSVLDDPDAGFVDDDSDDSDDSNDDSDDVTAQNGGGYPRRQSSSGLFTTRGDQS